MYTSKVRESEREGIKGKITERERDVEGKK